MDFLITRGVKSAKVRWFVNAVESHERTLGLEIESQTGSRRPVIDEKESAARSAIFTSARLSNALATVLTSDCSRALLTRAELAME
jgi:hypothetical protein